MARTGMIARGLRAMHRLASGDSTVYVLAKTAGADSLTELASTEEAYLTRNDDGTAVLSVAESDDVSAVDLRRAAGFAISSGVSGYRVWRKLTEAQPAYGEAARDWSFQIAPTGVTFTPAVDRLLETGVVRLIETGEPRRLEA